jgi:hypothetical protein
VVPLVVGRHHAGCRVRFDVGERRLTDEAETDSVSDGEDKTRHEAERPTTLCGHCHGIAPIHSYPSWVDRITLILYSIYYFLSMYGILEPV